MKSRVSEGSTDDNRSPQSEPYNQRRMVRRSGLARRVTQLSDYFGRGWNGKRLGARREDFSNSDTHPSSLVACARAGALSVGMGVIIRTFLGRGVKIKAVE